jgi:hypothetical protein
MENYILKTRRFDFMIKLILFLSIILLNVGLLSAQSKGAPLTVGIGAGLISTGSGHGNFYAPELALQKGRSSVQLAVLLATETADATGGKVMFKFCVNPGMYPVKGRPFEFSEPDLVQFNLLMFAQYLDRAPLCKSLCEEEKVISKDRVAQWETVRFSTADAAVGFEVKVNFTRCLSWQSNITAGIYHHFNYVDGMNHQGTSTAIQVGTGLFYIFN